jgi:tetratricopeptide (TPR) repeat protein
MIRLFAIVLIGVMFLQGCVPLAQAMVNIASVHLNKGLDYFTDGNYALALDEYKQAIDLGPTTHVVAYALSLRAAAYSQMGDYESALHAANASIELEPTVAISFISRGYVHLDLEQWQEAVADFDKAIALDDQLHQAYLGRAIAHVSLNHFDLAVADYKSAMSLAPNQPGIDQIKSMIETLEKWQRESVHAAATLQPTQSALCNWFNASQRLRSARIAGSTKFISFYTQYGADGLALVDPTARNQLLIALEEYVPYEREFIVAWQELGSIAHAEDVWNNELLAEQQKLAANEKMIQAIKSDDYNLLMTGAEELEQAIKISNGAVTSMLEIRENCLDELR